MTYSKLLPAGGLAIALAGFAFGQTATTDPVGFVNYTFGQGTQFSGISMVNPPVFAGAVSAVSGSTLTIAGANLNVGASLVAGEPYYLEVSKDPVNGGAFAGERFDVDTAATIAAANGTVLVKSSPENTLASVPAQLVGCNLVVRKHVTLGQLTQTMAGAFVSGDQLFMRTNGAAVLNFSFNGTDWRQGIATANATIVYPGVGFALLRNGAASTAGAFVGAVRTNDFVQAIRAGEQILCEGFPIESSPRPASPSATDPSRLYTNDQGATVFGNGDALFAYHPTSGTFTQFTYSTASNRWTNGLVNGNVLKLFQPTRGYYLISGSANNAYVHIKPFTL